MKSIAETKSVVIPNIKISNASTVESIAKEKMLRGYMSKINHIKLLCGKNDSEM